MSEIDLDAGEPESSQLQPNEFDYEVSPDPLPKDFPLAFYGDCLTSKGKGSDSMEVDGEGPSDLEFTNNSLFDPPSDQPQPQPVTRTQTPIVTANQQFTLSEKSFTQQYSGVYFARLVALRPRCIVEAERLWGEGFQFSGNVHPPPRHIPRILDIPNASLCWVVGTVYVEMALKPNILDEVTAEHWIVAPAPRDKYTSDSDTVTLEDEYGRLKLVGPALKNAILATGKLRAIATLFKPSIKWYNRHQALSWLSLALKIPPAISKFWTLHSRSLSNSMERKYVALMSGLNVGLDSASHLKTEIMVEWLAGWNGSINDQRAVSKVACVIVAGGLVGRETLKEGGRESGGKVRDYFDLEDGDKAELIHLDAFDLVQEISPHDPTTHSLPQQPLLSGLAPGLSSWSGTQFGTNPFECVVEGVRLLGHSGQPLHDLAFQTPTNSLLTLASHTLRWQHLAPTAPDTLWCYPFKGGDPFVIGGRRKGKGRATDQNSDQEQGEGGVWCPHVLFAGGGRGSTVETAVYTDAATGTRVRIVVVPEFSKSGVIALLDLATGDVAPVSFGMRRIEKLSASFAERSSMRSSAREVELRRANSKFLHKLNSVPAAKEASSQLEGNGHALSISGGNGPLSGDDKLLYEDSVDYESTSFTDESGSGSDSLDFGTEFEDINTWLSTNSDRVAHRLGENADKLLDKVQQRVGALTSLKTPFTVDSGLSFSQGSPASIGSQRAPPTIDAASVLAAKPEIVLADLRRRFGIEDPFGKLEPSTKDDHVTLGDDPNARFRVDNSGALGDLEEPFYHSFSPRTDPLLKDLGPRGDDAAIWATETLGRARDRLSLTYGIGSELEEGTLYAVPRQQDSALKPMNDLDRQGCFSVLPPTALDFQSGVDSASSSDCYPRHPSRVPSPNPAPSVVSSVGTSPERGLLTTGQLVGTNPPPLQQPIPQRIPSGVNAEDPNMTVMVTAAVDSDLISFATLIPPPLEQIDFEGEMLNLELKVLRNREQELVNELE
ncbi:hypothetical protein HDU93_003219 [Gonapodya sp. JEL0774]|nr:hypothetical protein HDU93_003219 [Gonapodya sp. JEL0774]